MCSVCLEEEIEDLKAKVKKEADRANTWKRRCDIKEKTVSELRSALSNTKAELSGVRAFLLEKDEVITQLQDEVARLNSVNYDLVQSSPKPSGVGGDEGTVSELRATLSNTMAELSGVRYDLVDTTKTLDNYRDMHVKMSRAKSELRKSVAGLEDTVRTLTEERDLARELYRGMVRKYAILLNR